MPSLEERIPAFAMWKMFNDTVPALSKMEEHPEGNVKKLANIINSEEFSGIFVYNNTQSLEPEEYIAISHMYKSFTEWLLGRFFYLLSYEKLSRIHSVIIDAQLRILYLISVTEPHVYNELTLEYSKALRYLTDYIKGKTTTEKSVILKILTPQQHDDLKTELDLQPVYIEITNNKMCMNLLTIVIKFFKKILRHDFTMFTLKQSVYNILDDFEYILSHLDLQLKLAVFDIYLSATENIVYDKFPPKLQEVFCRFSVYFEEIIYKVFNGGLELGSYSIDTFESLVKKFVSSRVRSDDYEVINARICTFLHLKVKSNDGLSTVPSKSLLDTFASFCPQFSDDTAKIDELLRSVCKDYNFACVRILEQQIFYELKNVYVKKADNLQTTWNKTCCSLKGTLATNVCNSHCTVNKNLQLVVEIINMSVRVQILLQNYWVKQKIDQTTRLFSADTEFVFTSLVKNVSQHANVCKKPVPVQILLEAVSRCSFICYDRSLVLLFKLMCSLIVKNPSDTMVLQKQGLGNLYGMLHAQDVDNKIVVQHLVYFFGSLNSDLHTARDRHCTIKMEAVKIIEILPHNNDCIEMVLQIVLHAMCLFENTIVFTKLIQLLLQMQQNKTVVQKTSAILPTIFCVLSSPYTKLLEWNDTKNTLDIHIVCEHCTSEKLEIVSHDTWDKLRAILNSIDSEKFAIFDMFPRLCHNEAVTETLFENYKPLFETDDALVKVNLANCLSSVSKHVNGFSSSNFTKTWMELAGDEDNTVRKALSEVIGPVFKHLQENPNKEKIFETFYTTFQRFTKISLQYSDREKQKSLLNAIENVSVIKSKTLTVYVMQLLLYFIMIPTSRHSLIAIDVFRNMANKEEKKTRLLYTEHRQQLCKSMVELCLVNQALINRDLSTSLEKISLCLWYFGSKDFVSQECQYLLPFMVSLIAKVPAVEQLIQEIAEMQQVLVSDLLARRYGNVFLHVCLNESNDVRNTAMAYLEKTTEMSGPALRKRNFQLIFHELLVNFHDNSNNVIHLLKLLIQEDKCKHSISEVDIQDYIQPKFLGVLQYFDSKLIKKHSDRKKVLLSLTKLFKFMGAQHLTPLRFKIIAMLQTALSLNRGEFPDLNCDVWDAFIKSCDIEALGPHLATIFVSVMPLMELFPVKINNVFRYLIVDNEHHFRDHIQDLFFVVDTNIDPEIRAIIRRHTTIFDKMCFKDQLGAIMKYLHHETIDVRLHGLKFVKAMLEKNREELDQMVLGYNGIAPTVVELLDTLTSGCREREKTLKLMCAEVIGELGAIEPSHLPRRYIESKQSFLFFINEDGFVTNILSELLKALQAEKNTQNVDRYALAIQELLKVHKISPDANSAKNYLWHQFPELQRQLMLPLLSSRYTIAQPVETVFPAPIYGSNMGTSFQSWIFNWTSSLVSTLSEPSKALLEVCLPSMKHDHRILMEFLPHILLHSLLEGEPRDVNKAYVEITTVINSFNRKHMIDDDVINVRCLKTVDITPTPKATMPEEDKQRECTKVVFILLDFLDRWTREWQWHKGVAGRNSQDYKKIDKFLQQFSRMQLASCNYQCREYSRALMYFEEHVCKHPDAISNSLSFLAELYAQLDESDGVAGVMALQQGEPSLEERILALEVSGKLADAAACYERMETPLKLYHLKGLMQCYLDLDNVNTALNFAKGAMEQYPQFGNMLLEMQAEPLWRLGQYDDLDSLVKRTELKENNSWGIQIGKALLHFKHGNRDSFQTTMEYLKLQQGEFLGAATLEEGAYQHGYNHIARLHALNELQHVEKITNDLLLHSEDGNYVNTVMSQLIFEWELRMKVVQESVKITEPILCLRRVALNQAKQLLEDKVPTALPFLNSLLGESWLSSAKTARAAGVHQQAYTYTIKAEGYAPAKLFVEKAKLHWLREEQEQALTTLRRGLENLMPDRLSNSSPVSQLNLEQRKICAEAKLLIASYNDLMSYVDTDTNIQHYKEAVEMFKEWEKSLVYLAQYYDRVFSTFSDEDRDTKGSDMQIHMINYFGKSLQYGSNYVYQSMPRLLSIWFDYGTRLLDVNVIHVKEERKNNLLKMTKLIDTFLDRLPAYIFLTAFSQLVSRICHPQKEVYIELKSIIIKLLLKYPQQTLWMMVSVIKSGYQVRARRCAEIFSDSRLKTPTMVKLVRDFTTLAEKLMELCNKEIPDSVSSTSVNVLLRSLPRTLSKSDFSEIMVPTHKFRKLVLPNPDFKSSQHNPFPNHYVYIVGIDDELTVLPSLQRPRKITLLGSDGKRYIQMLKPKDDLRKDFRLMEFNDIVNQLLSREADARQRRLNIRLYSVAPLNEECGLIEWVPNLVGLRPILMNLYKQRGINMKGKDLKELCCNLRDPLAKKREIFTKQLLPRHPAVLGEWFRRTFPDAQSWLIARTAYTRTTAVMSMVGYILGLGDRHGENILLDSMCGDVVHVDFNCLFNKGETFEWPERVPFRLTQNMVSAMGPLGVEGVFRKSCACTLRVLRTNTNTLMSIVTPFVYDPLVSWPRNSLATSSLLNAERTNEQALDHIKNIELRLQGIVKVRSTRGFSIPLSVEGQTDSLIKEAMSIDNLCQMYIGWGPYL